MNRSEITSALHALGWPSRQAASSQAIRNFQAGWALGPQLVVDGQAGPKTQAALKASLGRRAAGKGTASEHFSFSEARCRCGGTLSGCEGVKVVRELLVQLERLRHRAGHAITPVSIYRCPTHNHQAGGATSSQHLFGAACDPGAEQLRLKTADVKALGGFSGIGYRKRDGLVAHVDVRHVSGHNTTGGTPQHPTTWVYA